MPELSSKVLHILITASLLFLWSCKSNEEVKVNNTLSVDANAIKNMDIEKDEFTELVDDQIDNLSVEIISNNPNRTIQRASIEMKKFFSKKLKKYNEIVDPRKTFFNTWSLVYRFDNYVSKGDGKNLFGDQQALVVKTISGLLADHEKIAGKHLTKKQYKTASERLKNYAAEYPITGYFQDLPETNTSGFVEYLNIPLAPFKAVNAINKSGESIESISKTVARFTDIAEDLPDEIRWQLQVLAAQLQQNDILKTNTTSFAKLAESSEKLAAIIDKYPDRVSSKISQATKDLDSTIKQLNEISKQIDQSMTKLQTSSENFKDLGNNINQSTEKVSASLKQVESSSTSLTKAAEAVSKAVKDIQAFSEYLNKDEGDKKPEDKNEDSFLVEVEKASTALEKSAAEISVTLAKIIELGNSKPFSQEITALDSKAKQTLLATRQESETLVNYIFKKALILTFIIFALAMILVITRGKVSQKAK